MTAEERRVDRRRALLAAATELVEEVGVLGLSKRSVCARAQLNDRYFYEHFADSDALIEELVAELAVEFVDATLGILEDRRRDFRSQVHGSVEAAIDFVIAEPTRTALFISAPVPESLARARDVAIRTVASRLADVYIDRYPGRGLDHHDTLMIAFASVSGARELVAAWLAGDFDTTKANLIELLTSMMLAIVDMADQPTRT